MVLNRAYRQREVSVGRCPWHNLLWKQRLGRGYRQREVSVLGRCRYHNLHQNQRTVDPKCLHL